MNLQINGTNIYSIFFVTFLASFVLVFLTQKVAIHINAMDIPNERKIHKKPMPRLGGLAIYLSFLIGYILYGTVSTQMLSVLIGSFIIILTGIIDDVNPIKARYKFVAQVIAACIVVIYGKLYFSNITFLGQTFVFPKFVNMGLSILFIASCINIINFIDGLDGLATGISSIYFLTISIIGLVLNKHGGLDVVLSIIMLGSASGFLIHNFPPAKIFMGDTGSMFLGFIISVIALLGYKVATVTSIFVPIIILAIPIFDTLLAIFRRLLRGESIGKPDKEHIHHQLLKATSSPTKTILIIYAFNGLFSVISVLYVLGDNKLAMTLYLILMICFLFLVLKTDILFNWDENKKVKKKVKNKKEL